MVLAEQAESSMETLQVNSCLGTMSPPISVNQISQKRMPCVPFALEDIIQLISDTTVLQPKMHAAA